MKAKITRQKPLIMEQEVKVIDWFVVIVGPAFFSFIPAIILSIINYIYFRSVILFIPLHAILISGLLTFLILIFYSFVLVYIIAPDDFKEIKTKEVKFYPIKQKRNLK